MFTFYHYKNRNMCPYSVAINTSLLLHKHNARPPLLLCFYHIISTPNQLNHSKGIRISDIQTLNHSLMLCSQNRTIRKSGAWDYLMISS